MISTALFINKKYIFMIKIEYALISYIIFISAVVNLEYFSISNFSFNVRILQI